MDWTNLQITIIDVLDFAIVGILFYYLYKLLKGTLGFNIFIGIVLLYVIWWLVRLLEMRLLSTLLSQFVNIGVLILIIIFQPEIRRFLLIIGDQTLKQRSSFVHKYLNFKRGGLTSEIQHTIDETISAIETMCAQKIGSLIVFTRNTNTDFAYQQGVYLDAYLSKELIISIFDSKGPMHDGAIIVRENKVVKAGAVLRLASQTKMPSYLGLRHRAALGAATNSDDFVIVISEERGAASYAHQGELIENVSLETIRKQLEAYLGDEHN